MQQLQMKSDIRTFAEEWISDWNRRDVEAVLTRFSEDVTFTSPRAKAISGSTKVEGKSRLREYWTKALERIQSIHFTLDYVVGDGDRIGVVYVSEINGVKMRSVEFLIFGPDGLVREGEAMHGIEL
jgi:steroid delta-isomerase